MERREQLAAVPVLMLSTGYEPLFQTNWKRALSAIIGGRAEVIESHEYLTIGTSSGPLPFPTKVRFVSGIIVATIKKINVQAQLSRKNLYLRDAGSCQYCNAKLSLKSGTIDHVIPRSKGGKHTWENVVFACVDCNQKKGAKLLCNTNMTLVKRPSRPSISELAYRRVV